MGVVLFVTEFGDALVLVGTALAFALALALAGSRRAAGAFGLVFVAAIVVVLGAKLFLAENSAFAHSTGLHSPSGHVAGTLVLVGTIAWCVGWRGVAVPCAVLVAGVMAYTRVRLGYHTLTDVIAGGVLGGVVLAGAWSLAPTRLAFSRPVRHGWALLGIAAVCALALHGRRLPDSVTHDPLYELTWDGHVVSARRVHAIG